MFSANFKFYLKVINVWTGALTYFYEMSCDVFFAGTRATSCDMEYNFIQGNSSARYCLIPAIWIQLQTSDMCDKLFINKIF